jgi:hypothetical protein
MTAPSSCCRASETTGPFIDRASTAGRIEERFVYVTFKRAKLDPAEHLPTLKDSGYGAYHDLTEIQFKRRNHLAKTPVWSWLRRRDY